MTEKKHDDAPKAKAAEAPPQTFPFTASINEPQTVSLPVPENVEVPKPVIVSIDPDGCVIGDPDFDLHVTGEHFFADSVIHFAGHEVHLRIHQQRRHLTELRLVFHFHRLRHLLMRLN